MRAPALLTEVTRAVGDEQIVESVHVGHLVVTGPDGVESSLGDPDLITFIRSCAKPFQATACLELLAEHGDEAVAADLTDDEVAIAWASHRGEQIHLAAATRLLARSGTLPTDLTCPPAYPDADQVWPPASPGEPPSRIRYNCSGKHALFALTGRAMGLHGPALLDPEGPLQQRALSCVEGGVGPLSGWGTDGCGAPAMRAGLRGLADGYAALAAGGRWSRVRDAGLARPLLIGGTGRLESALLAHGVVAKVGAEGVFAAGWMDDDGAPHGVAAKAADGADRGAAVAVMAVLVDRGVVASDVWTPAAVTGGGRIAGQLRAAATVRALV